MSEAFIGEIRMIGWDWAPKGWAACDGQIMNIAQNQPLFSVIGTAFGGNGQTTFGLPDLRGRVPLEFSPAYPIGQKGGEEVHTLLTSEMAAHPHGANASSNTADQASPGNNYWAVTGSYTAYSPSATGKMGQQTVGQAGGGQPHANLQPYLAVCFVIALTGVYPERP